MRSPVAVSISMVLAGALLLSAAPVLATNVGGPAADFGAASQNVDLGPRLASDGTFVGAPGVEGSVDMSAWMLTSDVSDGEAPRFVSREGVAPAAAITPNAWSALAATGPNSHVYAVAVSGTDVYVGGNFYQSAGLPTNADFIAKWNGSSWSALGGSPGGLPAINGVVRAILIDGSVVYAGGDFYNAGGDAQADGIAVWNGSYWRDVADATSGDGAFNGQVHALAKYGADLYVGGYWYNAPVFGGSSNNPGDMILRWNAGWHWVGTNGTDGAIQGPVDALVATFTGVIAGGEFTNVGGDTTLDYLAGYDLLSATWAPVHAITNLSSYVRALYQSGSNLYVGGDFTDLDAIPAADFFAQWNGSQWLAPGSGISTSAIQDRVYSIVGSGSDVYVGGNFVNAGGQPTADRLAKWNGSAWSGLGSNGTNDGALNTGGAEPPGWVRALAISATALYAGGSFRDAANIPEADYVAAYGLGAPGNQKPDGRIRKGSGTLVGNNIYNTTGVNQTRSGSAAAGSTITFTISIQNDGTGAGKFNVAVSASGNVNYVVRYFHGTTEITSAVVAGTYATGNIAVGSAFAIKAKVKVLPAAISGSSTTRLVTITSAADAARIDAVKFVGSRQ